MDSRELNRTPSQSKITIFGQRRSEGGGNTIDLDKYFGTLGIVADDLEVAVELSVEAFSIQGDDDFSPPTGRNVRIEPHHFHASGIFDFGDGEHGISGVGNREYLGKGSGQPGNIPGVKIVGRNRNCRALSENPKRDQNQDQAPNPPYQYCFH